MSKKWPPGLLSISTPKLAHCAVERIKKMVGKSVSNIFLTHPDEDHYNYLKNFQKFRKDKIHFHLGGNLALWDEGAMSRNVAFNEIIKPLIVDQSVSMKIEEL